MGGGSVLLVSIKNLRASPPPRPYLVFEGVLGPKAHTRTPDVFGLIIKHSLSDTCFPTFRSVFYFTWTSFKAIIEFVALLFLFYVLAFWPQGILDLSSLTRDRTLTPCIRR